MNDRRTLVQQAIRMSGVEYRSPVGKHIALMKGKIEKTPLLGPRATAGKAINRTFDTAEEAFLFRAGSDAKRMFFTGTLADEIRDGDVLLMPDKAVDGYRSHFEPGCAPDIVSATKDHLAFRSKPGFLPVDIDTKSPDEVGVLWPEALFRFETPEEARKALLDVLPEAVDAPVMVTASSSSMIVDSKTGKLVKDAGGWRALIAIDDASQIPRILEVMHQRCWARGIYRYAFISKGGAFLPRSLVDLALARPTQPDYPCADLGDGLAKAEGATARWNVDGPFLRAHDVQIDGATQTLAADALDAAKREMKPAAEKLVAGRIEEDVKAATERGVPKEVARRAAQRKFEAGYLLGSDVIDFGGEKVSVIDLLLDGESFEGRVCLDPVEPDYDGGRAVGMFYWNKGLCPAVHSFAHGRKTYWLRHDAVSARKVLEALPDDHQAIVRVFALADLEAVEHDLLEKTAAKGLGLGNKVSGIRRDVEAFRDQAGEYRKSFRRDNDRNDHGTGNYGGEGYAEDLFYLPAEPRKVARIYRDRHLVESVPTLRYWRDGWWSWSGRHWDALPPDAIADALYAFTEDAYTRREHGIELWNPNRGRIGDVLEALRGLVRLDDAIEARSWLDGRPPEGTLVAAANGLLDIRTRGLTAHSPLYFNLNSVPFAYDPDAKCPTFDAFVASLWDEDDGARQTLGQMLGYLVSGRTDMQCLFGLIGSKRGGKGTIARLTTDLLGPANVASLTVQDLSYTFGLEPTIGKSLAILADVRTTGRNNSTLVQRLLSITGEDGISIQRKNRLGLGTRMPLRLMYISNESPYFGDASTAAAKRFVLMVFTRDFSGREDRQLGDKLGREMPGILNVALDGLADLEREERFTQSAAALEEVETIADLSSPIRVFVREECDLGVNFQVEKSLAYFCYRHWSEGQGMPPLSEPIFASRLYAACDGKVRRKRGRHADDRTQLFAGIKLRNVAYQSASERAFAEGLEMLNGGAGRDQQREKEKEEVEGEDVAVPLRRRRRPSSDEGQKPV